MSNKHLRCDMSKDCKRPVTHVGEKGFVYCTEDAARRRSVERCRKLRSWELDLLRSGNPLPSYKPLSKRDSEAAYLCASTKMLVPGQPAAKTVPTRESYSLTPAEMRALRDHWIDVCREARGDGDQERTNHAFERAAEWDRRFREQPER